MLSSDLFTYALHYVILRSLYDVVDVRGGGRVVLLVAAGVVLLVLHAVRRRRRGGT